MENLLSSRSNLCVVPESYILSPEKRPGNYIDFPHILEPLPSIDLQRLSHDREQLIRQIVNACRKFGFFQLVNHGVCEELMNEVLGVAKEFFELPVEEKASLYSEDFKECCRAYTSIAYGSEKLHYWRDNLRHHCLPLENHIQHWPSSPSRYREVMRTYSVEVRKLSLKILDLICEGLGLETGYFEEELSKVHTMSINHYPPCPDPTLTMGLPKHSDPNLITLLFQGDVDGLQVLNDDGQWLSVQPLPNAFVVNIAHILQIVSNEKLRSVDHRVITNKTVARTAVASFIHPSDSCIVEPAKALVDKVNPPLFKAFKYKDFLAAYIEDSSDSSNCKSTVERYKIQL